MQMKCKSAHAPASSIGRLQSDRPLMTVDIANRSALACLLFVCLFVFNVPVGTGWFHSRPFPVVYRRRRHRRQCLVLIGVAVHVRLSMAIDADRCDRPQSFFFFFFFFCCGTPAAAPSTGCGCGGRGSASRGSSVGPSARAAAKLPPDLVRFPEATLCRQPPLALRTHPCASSANLCVPTSRPVLSLSLSLLLLRPSVA